ncbi:hypothetical protein KUH03_11005 [Sphingobacterium sp. E70]|uniref:hypothetical protein n=1 Tax=Sphingobacterium sp. E70 TaxID=2853439 RepID=UPI00211C7FAF|nr:hypothetical protein [Sphingobacterium sp. E70]ULT27228.1 hypothetical protein KUH03_11005 [Sphingobacterium sp. E70]
MLFEGEKDMGLTLIVGFVDEKRLKRVNRRFSLHLHKEFMEGILSLLSILNLEIHIDRRIERGKSKF